LRIAIALFAATLVLLNLPAPARACSCQGGPPELYYSEASHVLRGVPISVELFDPGNGLLEFHYQIDVTACWKGEVTDPQPLVTLVEEAACGIELFVGEDYLIYANRTGSTLRSGLCGILGVGGAVAQLHLDFLGESTCPLTVEAATWGQVKATHR
jgi:hypothetical protein